MKPSARVALIAALTATTAPTWASLPFYSPNYTFDSTTGTGIRFSSSGGITSDGRAASTLRYDVSNVAIDHMIAVWRGATPLPTPQVDSDHWDPHVDGINRYGWMSGRTSPVGPGQQPAVWRPDGTRIDLPMLPTPHPDEPSAYAYDIDDAGFVVGSSGKYDDINFRRIRPVYWTPSFELVELPNPFATSMPSWQGKAKRISPNGIIAGFVYDTGITRAMRWDINGMAPVLSHITDTGISFPVTEAIESLDDGTTVGMGKIGDVFFGIFWTPDGEAIELRNLPNSTLQEVFIYEINNNHCSVGSARNSLGQPVGVRWSPTGEPFALDRLSEAPSNARDEAHDINDFNFAVGVSYWGNINNRAIIWTPDGDAININSLLEADEWNFSSASTITNTGWISGIAYYDPPGPPEAYRRPFSILVPFAGTYGMGDANFDESIDFADLLIVAQNYGTQANGSFDVGDFNLDGSVDFTDLLAIAQNYGDVLGDAVSSLSEIGNLDFHADWQRAQSMVPEPSLIGALIGLGLMLRRPPQLHK